MRFALVSRRNASSMAFTNTNSAMATALAKNSSLDGTGVEAPLTSLERLASQRIDPEKLRWKRAISDITDGRNILTGKQWIRAVAAVARSPLTLTSSSARPLLARAVEHCSFSLDGLDAGDFVELAFALAQARPLDSLEDQRATGWPRDSEEEDFGENARRMVAFSAPKVSETAMQEKHVDPFSSLIDEFNGQLFFGDDVSSLFWNQLIPLSFGEFKFHRRKFCAPHVNLLLSVACSSHIGRGASLPRTVENDVVQFVSAMVSDIDFWRFAHVQVQRDFIFRLVAALGILQERGLLSDGWPSGSRPADRVSRLLRLEALQEDIDLSSLFMLRLGLRGLGLSTSRIAAEVNDKLISITGGAPLPTDDICNALLLLHTCGHLNANEEWASKLICLAANAVDRLRPGEKMVLRLLLHKLAVALNCNFDRHGHPAGSAECIVCSLASRRWFKRRKREETSWFKGPQC